MFNESLFDEPIPHGGYCCGMTHIQGLNYHLADNQTIDESVIWLKGVMLETMEESFYGNYTGELEGVDDLNLHELPEYNHLFEIVLTEHQVGGKIDTILELCGFKEVNRFKNGNSENVCIIFHCIRGLEDT